MSNYYLFLDDNRIPHKVDWVELPKNVAWEIVRTYEEFVKIINEKGVPKFVSYDCDLCEEHYAAFFSMRYNYILNYKSFKTKCGLHCLEWLLNLCEKRGIKHPEFVAHTQNIYARSFIKYLIEQFNNDKKSGKILTFE